MVRRQWSDRPGPAQRAAGYRAGLPAVDEAEAQAFLEQFYVETAPFEPFEQRLREIRDEIAETGSYEHTRRS